MRESDAEQNAPPMRVKNSACSLDGNQLYQVRRWGWRPWRLWPRNEIIWIGDGGHEPYCLGLKNNLAESGIFLQIQECDRSAGQDWFLSPKFNTLSPSSDVTLCVQPFQGGTAEGVDVELAQCLYDGSNKQQWDLIDPRGVKVAPADNSEFV